MEIGGGSGGVSLETHNLRDLLRMKEEEHVNNRTESRSSSSRDRGGGSSGLTLLALFSASGAERSVNPSSRTLYDIIREERMSSEGGNSWRQLTEKIQGARNLLSPADEAVNNNHVTLQNSSHETERRVDRANGETGARRSLMTLMAEKERQVGVKEEEVEELNSSSSSNSCCCVCMVRQKGAAFIPCGHTFCRECSRELWVHRGNCPICNKLILEILDIF